MPMAKHAAAMKPESSGRSPGAASSDASAAVADGPVGVALGVITVVGPNGQGRVSVDTLMPSGPMVMVSPPITVVVVPDPGPTVYVVPPMTTTDAPILVMVAPPATAKSVAPGFAAVPPSVVP
jgi:hypothetical protein